ncbi:hypothetical protein AB0F18_37545 [Streptomyces sp. NPDC029216]|uniref:hypothetical protein n=1 Tax=Streptomyces sp. NPDC029216 TaxID=3154701 RepID=UPI0033CED1E0
MNEMKCEQAAAPTEFDPMLTVVQVLGVSNEDEMVACFLSGELSSQRFGQNLRSHLAVAGQAEQLLTHPDLSDAGANFARRALLGATRVRREP